MLLWNAVQTAIMLNSYSHLTDVNDDVQYLLLLSLSSNVKGDPPQKNHHVHITFGTKDVLSISPGRLELKWGAL